MSSCCSGPHEHRRWSQRWTGPPGRASTCPAVYVEHNAPRGRRPRAAGTRWRTGRTSPLVHVTAVQPLMWDCGAAPTTVIEHGIVDPGHLYTGELGARRRRASTSRSAAWRVDRHRPAAAARRAAAVEVYGMGMAALADVPARIGGHLHDDVPQHGMHADAGAPAARTCIPTAGPSLGPVADRGDDDRHAGGGARRPPRRRRRCPPERRACSAPDPAVLPRRARAGSPTRTRPRARVRPLAGTRCERFGLRTIPDRLAARA